MSPKVAIFSLSIKSNVLLNFTVLSVALFWLLGYAWTDFVQGNRFLGYRHFAGHELPAMVSALFVKLIICFLFEF